MSRAACCAWIGLFALAYGVLAFASNFWPSLTPSRLPGLFVALGAACVANAVASRSLHCFATGPLFLILAGLSAADRSGALYFPDEWTWPAAAVGVAAAFTWEALTARRGRRNRAV